MEKAQEFSEESARLRGNMNLQKQHLQYCTMQPMSISLQTCLVQPSVPQQFHQALPPIDQFLQGSTFNMQQLSHATDEFEEKVSQNNSGGV